ncbi:MAG: Trigger factor [candidate division WS6 bacterium GW2011_GWF2_39_15]|uniref:Trigger factor n=1 Tax=candidate division WS6 bacterium GW2011_GWF2_39_15 TaxID=1619100 RepID=A0A0G0QX81_9BACT|nr:MAG: Trigger factor [candidate division WS6 bacterium GW2011_GWF2_39_15]
MDKNYTRKDVSKESIELTLSIPSDAFIKSYNTLLEKESRDVDMKGFRKGTVPSEIIEGKLKERLMFETFERIAPLYVSQAVTGESIELVAPPAYKGIHKLEKGKDISFTVVCTVMPEFKLGNMKKVKVESKKVEVDEKEMESVMKELEQRKTTAKKGTDKWALEIAKSLNLTDVKTLNELKEEVKERLLAQKEMNIRKEQENSVLLQAIELCKITIPQAAIDYEALERENAFSQTLAEKKLTMEQFLTSNNIKLETMREMWKKDADEALKTDVFLKLYAKENKVEVSDEELQTEVDKVKKEHAGHDHDYYDDPQWREYIKRVILKQKAYDTFIAKAIPVKKGEK